jgi:formylmethanofuran dehydrogenase subunit B
MSNEKFTRESLETEDTSPSLKPPSPQEGVKDFDTEYHSRICTGCNCLCDDVSYYLKKGHMVRTLNLCEIAMKKLRSVTADERILPLSSDILTKNLREASKLLKNNGPPLVLGADALDEKGIQASRRFAKKLKGIWLPWGFTGMSRFYECVKQYGWASSLLDEIRDRAETVIFWRADPLDTHHRHLSRYSFFPRGRYTELGNTDRNLAVIADYEAVIEPLCQQFFNIQPDEDIRLIKALMNPPLEPAYDHRDFPILVNALQRSSYIAVFVDPENTDHETLKTLFEWSESINTSNMKRMVILPFFNAGSNIEGFTRISLEYHATCSGFDFSGKTQDLSDSVDWDMVADTTGSVVMFESGPEGAHRKRLPASLSEKPLIIITPFKQESVENADITIPVALSGIETDGVFFRADGMPLLSKKIDGLEVDEYPSAHRVLKEILKAY